MSVIVNDNDYLKDRIDTEKRIIGVDYINLESELIDEVNLLLRCYDFHLYSEEKDFKEGLTYLYIRKSDARIPENFVEICPRSNYEIESISPLMSEFKKSENQEFLRNLKFISYGELIRGLTLTFDSEKTRYSILIKPKTLNDLI